MKKVYTLFIIILMFLISIILYIIYKKSDINENIIENTNKNQIINNTVNLTLVGDFLYEQPYYNAINNGEEITNYLSLVKDYFQNDDLSIGNMEVPITNGNLKISGAYYSFCAPEYVGKEVINVGMDILSTANNHTYDRQYEGVMSTIDFFKNNSNILTVGTNKINERDINKNIKEINGIKFGILAYTYGTNASIPYEYADTINLYYKKDILKKDITELRDKVDVLIVLMHWGTEFTFNPNNSQKEYAKLLNELGVDIIVGAHSHCIQPIEWIKTENHNTLVYYGLGNFVSADSKVTRANNTFKNAYQFGLLSQLKVTKLENNIIIDNITTEPIINYYDKDERNYLLIPYSKYTSEYETTHNMYNKTNFTKEFINSTYESVIDEEFRK